MKNKYYKVFLVASAAIFNLSFATLTLAATPFYIGAGVGLTRSPNICEDLGGGATFDGACDKKDIGYKIVGGMKFTEYLGAEIGYVGAGKYQTHGTLLGNDADGEAKAKGVQMGGIAFIPINDDVEVLVKLGLFHWYLDTRRTVGAAVTTASAWGNGAFLGLGFKLDVDKYRHFSVRAEWERFQGIGKQDITGEGDIDFFSFSGFWQF